MVDSLNLVDLFTAFGRVFSPFSPSHIPGCRVRLPPRVDARLFRLLFPSTLRSPDMEKQTSALPPIGPRSSKALDSSFLIPSNQIHASL